MDPILKQPETWLITGRLLSSTPFNRGIPGTVMQWEGPVKAVETTEERVWYEPIEDEI